MAREVAWLAASDRPACCRAAALPTRVPGAPGSTSGDLPVARRTVGFRLAALVRDGKIVVGLPPRRDSEVESRPNCRCPGDVPLSRLQIARRTTRQTTPRTRRSRPRSPARLPASRPSPSMSPKRASPVDGQDERARPHSHRDRRVTRRPARAVAAILEREPWRQCGKPGRSTERPNSTPHHAAVLGPRARVARALTGVAWCRHGALMNAPHENLFVRRKCIVRKLILLHSR
jgi:hypothetical protein